MRRSSSSARAASSGLGAVPPSGGHATSSSSPRGNRPEGDGARALRLVGEPGPGDGGGVGHRPRQLAPQPDVRCQGQLDPSPGRVRTPATDPDPTANHPCRAPPRPATSRRTLSSGRRSTSRVRATAGTGPVGPAASAGSRTPRPISDATASARSAAASWATAKPGGRPVRHPSTSTAHSAGVRVSRRACNTAAGRRPPRRTVMPRPPGPGDPPLTRRPAGSAGARRCARRPPRPPGARPAGSPPRRRPSPPARPGRPATRGPRVRRWRWPEPIPHLVGVPAQQVGRGVHRVGRGVDGRAVARELPAVRRGRFRHPAGPGPVAPVLVGGGTHRAGTVGQLRRQRVEGGRIAVHTHRATPVPELERQRM